jgi:hypothetical protein
VQSYAIGFNEIVTHLYKDDWGQMRMINNDCSSIKDTKAGKGQLVYAPRGEFHTYKNIDSSSGKLMLIISPPQFEEFFEEIGIPIEDKESFQPPQITPAVENVIKTAAKYGLEIKT